MNLPWNVRIPVPHRPMGTKTPGVTPLSQRSVVSAKPTFSDVSALVVQPNLADATAGSRRRSGRDSMIRPLSSPLKPMGEVVRDFAASAPTVRRPERLFVLPISPNDCYADPERHLPDLYAQFLAG